MAKHTTSRSEFLRALFAPLKGGMIELRAIPLDKTQKVVRQWVTRASEIDVFAEKYGQRGSGYGVFFGVCKRANKGGKKQDVMGATCLWADIDCLANGLDINATAEMVMQLPVELQPSAMINSGGGLHLYWFFSASYDFSSPSDHHLDCSWVEGVNSKLREIVGGDAVQDVTRVMRLPETWNNKRAKKSECRIVFCRPHARFEFFDLVEAASEYQFCLVGNGFVKKTLVEKGEEAKAKINPVDRYAHIFGDKRTVQKQLTEMWRDKVREHAPRGYIGIHEAQVVTTARLALRDKNDDRVIEQTCKYMQLVPSLDAHEWDWAAEASKLRNMIVSWREKVKALDEGKKKNGRARKVQHGRHSVS